MTRISLRLLLLAILIGVNPVQARPHSYRAQGFRFNLSLELVPSKMMMGGESDYLWPAMADPQLGLLLHRVSGADAQVVLKKEKEFFFRLSQSANFTRSRTLLGHRVEVGEQRYQGRRVQTCLIPVEGGWLFLGVSIAPNLSPQVLERTWAELSRTLCKA